jgi:hypothetical protein
MSHKLFLALVGKTNPLQLFNSNVTATPSETTEKVGY